MMTQRAGFAKRKRCRRRRLPGGACHPGRDPRRSGCSPPPPAAPVAAGTTAAISPVPANPYRLCPARRRPPTRRAIYPAILGFRVCHPAQTGSRISSWQAWRSRSSGPAFQAGKHAERRGLADEIRHSQPILDLRPRPGGSLRGGKAKAQWAENHGFTWFSVMDHLIQIPPVGAPDEPFMEGWTALSALAAVTSRIRLATLATSVAYRNPAHLAKIAAGVDLISRGRLTLGIGAGWFETEYRQYGWEFPGPAGGAHPADGGGGPAYPRDVDGEADHLSRQVFPCSRTRSSSRSRYRSRTRRS